MTDSARDPVIRRLTWPNTERLNTALMLATDWRTCADLLAGRPVNPERLDPGALKQAHTASLVTLTRPIDLLSAA